MDDCERAGQKTWWYMQRVGQKLGEEGVELIADRRSFEFTILSFDDLWWTCGG